MARLGRANDSTAPAANDAGSSYKALFQEYEETKSRIRAILADKKDISELEREEKNELCVEYRRAANQAQKLASMALREEDVKKFEAEAAFMNDRAQKYGSIMKVSDSDIMLDDVKGLKEVKAVVRNFIYMIEHPEILKIYDMQGGMGMLLYGAPGTGKTMIAEAIANEVKKPLYVITPADIFKSYVGESEQSVKRIFAEMETCEDGAILFVDECESIFSKRGQDDKDYKSAVTTELLQRLNGYGVDGSKRILIGATNRPDKIDPAYLRYKRFSHIIHVTPPDAEAMLAIIAGKLKKIPSEVSAEELLHMAQMYATDGYYSGADLCGIIESACGMAIEQLIATNAENINLPVTYDMFKAAFDKKLPSISNEVFESYANFKNCMTEPL
ncbi:MAG: ATP-binding protein [Clostridia bacterium]|nr:ATP-binding protein [Clostridia bacterium]